MKKNIFLSLITIVLVVTLVFSSCMLVKRFFDYNNANTYYEEKQEQYTEIVSLPEQTKEIEKEKLPITVNFEGLLKENKDIIGWLYLPDSPINYPVVQASNNSEYLYKGINGQYLISGTIFADFRNREIGVDENFIMYGHNMKNQTMFGVIDNYSSQSFYEKNPIIYYLTPNKNYKIQILAGKIVPFNDEIYTTSPKTDAFGKHIKSIVDSCDLKTEVKYDIGDKIITLSTCTDNSGKTRYILIGKYTEF